MIAKCEKVSNFIYLYGSNDDVRSELTRNINLLYYYRLEIIG